MISRRLNFMAWTICVSPEGTVCWPIQLTCCVSGARCWAVRHPPTVVSAGQDSTDWREESSFASLSSSFLSGAALCNMWNMWNTPSLCETCDFLFFLRGRVVSLRSARNLCFGFGSQIILECVSRFLSTISMLPLCMTCITSGFRAVHFVHCCPIVWQKYLSKLVKRHSLPHSFDLNTYMCRYLIANC